MIILCRETWLRSKWPFLVFGFCRCANSLDPDDRHDEGNGRHDDRRDHDVTTTFTATTVITTFATTVITTTVATVTPTTTTTATWQFALKNSPPGTGNLL